MFIDILQDQLTAENPISKTRPMNIATTNWKKALTF